MKRDPHALSDERFDVAIVGAGVLGAAVALEAVARGLRVALVDRGDFGGETSANSLRILHGGVRSISRGGLRRGRNARRQLIQWNRFARRLVDPLAVVAPTRSRVVPVLGALVSNACLAPGMGEAPPRARSIRAAELRGRFAGLDVEGVAALEFEDGLAYSPERLVLEMVLRAQAAGALPVNYAEVTGGTVSGGRLLSVRFEDRLTGEDGEIRADLFVNAAGPSLAVVTEALGGRPEAADPPLSYSLNLLVRPRELPCAIALGFGGRRYFFVPWRGELTIGTAHLPVGERPGREEAVARFLEAVDRVWTGEPIGMDDVRHVQEGWALADSTPGEPARLSETPRIAAGTATGIANLVCAASHKFTAAFDVGRRALEGGLRAAGLKAGAAGAPAAYEVPAAPPPASGADRPPSASGADGPPHAVPRAAEAVIEHTRRVYGVQAARRLAGAGAEAPIVPDVPVVRSHVAHAVRHEMAVTEEDILHRRTELGPRGRVTDEARELARAVLAEAGRQ